MALRRFHFLNPMIHSQTHTLEGWPGHRLVQIGLATRPSMAKWQFQNSFLLLVAMNQAIHPQPLWRLACNKRGHSGCGVSPMRNSNTGPCLAYHHTRPYANPKAYRKYPTNHQWVHDLRLSDWTARMCMQHHFGLGALHRPCPYFAHLSCLKSTLRTCLEQSVLTSSQYEMLLYDFVIFCHFSAQSFKTTSLMKVRHTKRDNYATMHRSN